MRIKKTLHKVFSSQSNLLYPKQAVSTTVSKIMAKNTMFFLMEIGRNFQKKVSFVERRLFSKCSNVHFDRKPDTPAKKFLPKVQNELKKLRKILQKDWHFPSIFSSGLLQTCGRMQEKRDTSRTPSQMWKIVL